jgi:hypothetical protein
MTTSTINVSPADAFADTLHPLRPALRSPLGDRVPAHVARQAVRQAQAVIGLLDPAFLPPTARPLISVRGQPPPRVVLGFGLGCDSSTILARWLTDPSSRNFELHELAVITAVISSSS